MAKGQMRKNKEKKKPKAEKDKKGGGSAYASQYAAGSSKPNQNPFAKKG